jgi:outer membrane protein OmpU
MKKILLATTMLVGTAGFAAADVTLSGNGRMGIVNAETVAAGDKETAFDSRVRASVNLSASSDGGLEFGGSFGIHDNAGAAAGTAGSVFISGAFGKLTMGSTDSAAQNAVGQLAGVGYAGTGDGNEIAYLTGGDTEMALYTFSSAGLTAHVSLGQPSNADDTFSVGAAYATDAFSVAFGYEDSSVQGTQTSVAASATTSGVTAKVIYMTRDNVTGFDPSSMGLSATYAMDAVSLTAYYREQETSDTDTATFTGIGAAYTLGGGATLAGGVADNNGLARADLGVNFSF